MFLLFFLYYAWYEGFQIPSLDLFAGVVYSACAFLLVGSVFLTNSRATLLIFGGFVALYGVLLPKGVRARLLSRGGVSFVSFAAVASKMDAALGANDSASMKQMLVAYRSGCRSGSRKVVPGEAAVSCGECSETLRPLRIPNQPQSR